MPSEIMDQRHLSSVCMASAPSSFFSSGLCFPNERQAECWKPDSLPHYPGTGLAGEMGSNSVEPLKHFDLFDQDMAPWKAARQETALKSTLQSTRLKNDLFSSSLLETFGRKLILSSSDHLRENGYQDEPLESSREIEARVIGDLLPDDDELISGVTDGMEYIAQQNYDDTEDDFFCSIGGMELEANDVLDPSIGVANCQHLSRNFFVGNIDGSVEDSELRALFEQYGSIRNLYTACKLRGFVRVSYYDLRSACSAVKSLQSKTLRSRKLDLQFSFPKQDNLFEGDVSEGIVEIFSLDFSVSNDDLLKIFASFGDVKEVREIPHKRHHKLIEFYDVRAAQAVLHGSNGTEFLGNKIRVLSPKPRAPRWSVNQQLSPDLEQRESTRCCQLASPNNHGSINHGAISPYLHSPHRPLDNGHFPHSLSSPLLVSSSGNMGGFAELNVNHNGLANGLGSPYSRSLPEYHDCPTSRLPVNSLGPIPYTTINPNHVHGVCTDGVNSHPFDYNHGLRASMTRNAWSSGIPYQHQQQPRHSQGSPVWSNSPSLVNFAGSPSQAHGPMINGPFLPVGSAPSGNNLGSTLWDRRAGGPHFHLGLHPLELSSQGFGPARYSPQQRAQTLHGRNPMIPPLSPFESPNERARVRRSDSSSNQAENKRQFELDIERIIRGEDCRTTLMIKNIPNKYTSKMLLAAIDENHHGTYDFIYLPIDFKNKCNVGYAFINMVDPEKIIPFFETFNGKKWEKFNSEKVASLAYGRIQGKAALIAHFQNSSLMNEDKRCRPILFQTEGPNAGDQEPFPMGANVRPRHAKSRTNSYPSSPSPATSPDGDGSPNGTDSSSGSPSD